MFVPLTPRPVNRLGVRTYSIIAFVHVLVLYRLEHCLRPREERQLAVPFRMTRRATAPWGRNSLQVLLMNRHASNDARVLAICM